MTTTNFPGQPETLETAGHAAGSWEIAANASSDYNHAGDRSALHEAVGERLLLTVSEAAQRLGIGRSLLYELLADGQVESIHVGRLRRIPIDALADYIDRQRGGTRGSAD